MPHPITNLPRLFPLTLSPGLQSLPILTLYSDIYHEVPLWSSGATCNQVTACAFTLLHFIDVVLPPRLFYLYSCMNTKSISLEPVERYISRISSLNSQDEYGFFLYAHNTDGFDFQILEHIKLYVEIKCDQNLSQLLDRM